MSAFLVNSINYLKTAGKRAFSAFGLTVQFEREPLAFLKLYDIRTVLDIGANTGQFARQARKLFPHAYIFSFEPSVELVAKLNRKMKRDPYFRALPFALGAQDGGAVLNENHFSPSSSLLEMTDLHRESFPWTTMSRPIRVEVRTLDSWAAEQQLIPPLLVKMDVQGYEHFVISGGLSTLSRATCLIVEVSFHPLYEQQFLFDDIYSLVRTLGFRTAGMLDNLYAPESGRILQSNVVFLRD